ncbi:hypothetical protein SOPP22_16900 [Shewanella sp. OPT22]|nr:hypothetical protein SOPP22_16900 [Shewanella sp. OPT22]
MSVHDKDFAITIIDHRIVNAVRLDNPNSSLKTFWNQLTRTGSCANIVKAFRNAHVDQIPKAPPIIKDGYNWLGIKETDININLVFEELALTPSQSVIDGIWNIRGDSKQTLNCTDDEASESSSISHYSVNSTTQLSFNFGGSIPSQNDDSGFDDSFNDVLLRNGYVRLPY